MVVDVVMPARDEVATVAANVAAAASCAHVRTVIVVDDGSTDGTGEVAAGAGATVVRRDASAGSKAQAMRLGVESSDASHILFVDADCTDLRGGHLDRVCEPVLDGRAEMSLGAFDYGWLNWLVLYCPPLSGERIVPRWVWEAVPQDKLDGYTIEVRLNEVICEGGFRTSARTMTGVFHRTKRDKFGRIEGLRRTWQMYRSLLSMLRPVGDVRWRTYWFYLRGLTIEPPASGAS
ncbi:glycosyltransferase family 2 protein [Actinospongicola halichondriae]|uniref:glycosyltransferase family 2 protein n=1 Tax=Actinospongicola halichondriae TaxID=3236844 RepID=UPI003D4ECDE1